MLTVTSYFNPMRSRRRLANYRTFRPRLDVPLITVELAFDGQFELTSSDADHLIQLSGGDIMWQKERLLNVALEVVPDKVEELAWIDCDLVFESVDWPDEARRALKSDNVIQLFSEVRYLDKSSSDKLEFDSTPDLWRSGAGSQLATGEFKDVCLVRAESIGARKAPGQQTGLPSQQRNQSSAK